jgi:hypothetical protein
LPDGHLVVAKVDLDGLHDRLYALEAALDDVTADLAELGAPPSRASDRSRAAAYAAALAHLQMAAEDLRGLVVEPVTS